MKLLPPNPNRSYSHERLIVLGTILVIVIMLLFSLFWSSSSSTAADYEPVSPAFIKNPHLPITSSLQKESLDHTSGRNIEEDSLNSPRVAVAALLTSNSKRGEQIHRAIDGLAVLRRSMLENTPLEDQKHFSFVAILTDSVDEKWESILKEKVGWSVIKRYHKPPVDPSEIRNKQISKEIVTDGAIGIDELTKLRVFEWGDEFDVVILLDADILFHKPFPELYKKNTGVSLRWTKGGWAIERINGGFLVIEPKGDIGKKYFSEMMDLIREGDFRPGTGWRGSGIGWTYGGRTVQGILPYYFLHHLLKYNQTKDAVQLDRCRYNNMDQLPECKRKPLTEITSNHFTGDCVKPWWCGSGRSTRCAGWTKKWKEVYVRELKAQGTPEFDRLSQKILTESDRSCDFVSLAKVLYERS